MLERSFVDVVMFTRTTTTLLSCLIAGAALGVEPARPPTEAFARSPAVSSLTLSHDGRYLAYVSGIGDKHAAIVVDRKGEKPPKVVLTTQDRDPMDLSWCRWANATRLLCGFRKTYLI